MLVLHHPKYLIQGGLRYLSIQGFPKSGGAILGVPMLRTLIFWGLCWGPLFWDTTMLSSCRILSISGISLLEAELRMRDGGKRSKPSTLNPKS